MPEYNKAINGKELSRIGLTQTDIDRRGVVAVGYCERELFPPYDSSGHERRASKILAFLKGKGDFITSSCYADVGMARLTQTFPTTRVIQVVGGLAELCVKDALETIIINRRHAYLDSGLIFSERSSLSNSALARMATEDLLQHPLTSCISLGRGRFILSRG